MLIMSNSATRIAVIPQNKELKNDIPVTKPDIQINRAINSPPTDRICNNLARKGKVPENKVLNKFWNIFSMIPLFYNISALPLLPFKRPGSTPACPRNGPGR
jgi:hypothetical protein